MTAKASSWLESLGTIGLSGDENAGSTAQKTYQPWRLNAQSLSRDLRIVPSPSSDESLHWEPLMQAISIRVDKKTSQLCFLCSSTGNVIFVEADSLDTLIELAQIVSDKKPCTVNVYDQYTHGILNKDSPYISSVKVEVPEK